MKSFLTVICLFLFFSDVRAQSAYELIKKEHEPTDLKKDIDFVRKRLESEHPSLYWYIDKLTLDKKFDSLKNTITKPLKSVDFNPKVLSVLSSIGDGHLNLIIDGSKLTEADVAKYDTKLMPPIYQLEYKIIDHKLYITNNLSKDKTIEPGTEILSIDNQPASDLIDVLANCIPSDGFNKTFKYFLLSSGQLPYIYRSVYGWRDSLSIKLKYNNITKTAVLKTHPTEEIANNTNSAVVEELKFLTPDNSVAYFKIGTFFNNGRTEYGYNNIFKALKDNKSTTLILDLRGNLGGDYHRTANLFTYFIDTPTYFVKRPTQIIKNAILPSLNKLRRLQMSFLKANGALYPLGPNPDAFKGKIYVLINGGSFSSTSLLAGSLQSIGKAVFIGEETGGGRNRWTAGYFKNEELPVSKLTLKYGIIPFEFTNQSEVNGRGVMPDVAIKYTIEDYLAKKDLELEWALKDIESKNVILK